MLSTLAKRVLKPNVAVSSSQAYSSEVKSKKVKLDTVWFHADL